MDKRPVEPPSRVANPNAETLGGVIVYAALAAVIGAVVWYFSFRPKK